MLGTNVKRGVATTLERVFNASGSRIGKLEVLWSGKTAGIIFDRGYYATDVKVIFPSIDDKADIPMTTFNNMIGYALHELGHAWYTENRPWDRARAEYGSFVSSLINGLEDPRIERCVIDSGRAPNARVLFENLVNSILDRDGYVQPDDKKNIPFLLAIEGRRMNGYDISVKSIIDASPWKKDIKWALKKAHVAKDTNAIVKIAVALFKRLTEKKKDEDEGDQGNGQGGEKQPPQGDGGQQGDGQGEGQGDQPNGQQGDPADGDQGQGDGDPSDGDDPSDDDGSDGDGDGSDSDDGQPSDGDGQDGQGTEPSDGQGDKPTEGQADQPDGQPTDESGGSGKSDEQLDGGREVEPSDFIEGELDKHSTSADDKRSRPCYGKPEIATFNWR
jgi:hypothetical protein